MPSIDAEFSVVCLCAEWCGACREYRAAFDEVAARFDEANFIWLDIETHAEALGEIDIENFPTLVVYRGDAVLYYDVMLPYAMHLARTLEAFGEMSAEQSRDYAFSNAERRRWQADPDLRRLRVSFAGKSALAGRIVDA